MENCPQTLFFLGNSMTIKFGNFTNFIVRNFVVIWEAPNVRRLLKLSAYKMGASMRLFKLHVLSLFKLLFRISGENRSLNEV